MANTNEARGGSPGHTPAPRRRKRRKKGSAAARVFATIGKVLGTLLLVGITTCAFLACFAAVYIQQVIIPQTDLNLGDFIVDMSLSSTMYYTDSSGTLQELRTIYGSDGNRVWVEYEDIPENLINATIAIEDHRFRQHHGVDWIRTAKGVLLMFTGGDIQGGSTITQQLIKNLTTDKEVTVQRKILEIFRALEFEKKYSKDQILEAYLNYIYLGERCNGVYTAAYTYFGKDVSQLSLAECASLISITNNPSLYNPYVNRENNTKRANLVISRMLELEMISQAEYDQAKAELDAGLNFVRGEDEERDETAYTWYEDQVIDDVVADLMEKYDYSETTALNMIYYGGLTIETCLDMDIQNIVDSVYENMDNLPYISSSGQQLQSAIVIVDPNGNVVALSGGMGEKEGSRIWSRATDSKRAPGSAFKPLSVYAPAIDMGLITPGTVFDDSPYQLEGGSPYPSNSYGSYLGRMTVRDAVKISSNTVAIKTLAMLTPQASFDFLTTKLGFINSDDGLVYQK
uniref:transglycosylase domain-containing protein n=1 Tax=uncultured Pseudoflavonifractor sp. TaxID=1221379 RepID=UPI0025E275DE